MKLPQAFTERMEKRLGSDFPAFLSSYGRPPQRGLRVNTLKISPEEFRRRAPFPLGETVSADPACLYIEEERPGADPYHFAGLYYLQEPSAMTVGDFTNGGGRRRVLDLCAAPGGKTTQIAAQMAGKGILVANEINFPRAKILSQNVERMGIANCAVTSAPPERLAAALPGFFDLVLVDAPCSGEGMFKKEPNAIPEWSEENVARCAARQRDILEAAAKTVADGGTLLYSTCTFAEEEDEWQIENFLSRHPEFTLESERKLYPHAFRGEGHYCAVLKRELPASQEGTGDVLSPSSASYSYPSPASGEPLSCPPPASGCHGAPCLNSPVDCERAVTGAQASAPGFAAVPAAANGVGEARPHTAKPYPVRKNAAAERAFASFSADLFGSVPEGEITTLPDGRMYLVPAGMPALDGVRLLRLGVELGEWDGRVFKPAHALAVAFGARAKRKLSLSREDAGKYLRGETFPSDLPGGWCIVCVEEFPLGLGKCVNGVVKNHFPKGLRPLS